MNGRSSSFIIHNSLNSMFENVVIRLLVCFLIGSIPFAVVSMTGSGVDIRSRYGRGWSIARASSSRWRQQPQHGRLGAGSPQRGHCSAQ